jgi:hypothetical protein
MWWLMMLATSGVANNWYDADVVINKSYNARTSTFPGGQGLVVTYGVAAPVQNPLMGAVRKPNK